ncbi:MAG: hypothetical protein AMJ70_07900 [Dehalococcoidia bacterium SG8_51_3]|nr:MAG: hypothetical protein AMJ70_07900 [Dehalococcoidia bacterium SG8_51_3]
MKLLVVFLLAITLFAIGCSCDGDKEAKIPINLEEASNVGSLQIEASYDATVLQVVQVEAGDLSKNALIESNLDNPGIIIIGIVDSSGISGSGSVVSITFDILEKDSASSLTIKNATAHDVNTLVDLPTSLTQGNFAGGDVFPPTIRFE